MRKKEPETLEEYYEAACEADRRYERALIFVFVLLLCGLFFVATALAHGAYTGKRDPVTSKLCCGGSDCNVVPFRAISFAEGGVRVVLSLDEARKINPSTLLPVDAFIPEARIQASPDSDTHICIERFNRTAPTFGVICFWFGAGA